MRTTGGLTRTTTQTPLAPYCDIDHDTTNPVAAASTIPVFPLASVHFEPDKWNHEHLCLI